MSLRHGDMLDTAINESNKEDIKQLEPRCLGGDLVESVELLRDDCLSALVARCGNGYNLIDN